MKVLKSVLTFFLAMTLFTNCGGGEKKEDSEEKIKLTSDSNDVEEDENVSSVVITADDAMKFNTGEIRVKAGTKVKLTLRHIGKMDANVMGHNVVVLKKDVEMSEFAAKAATEKENGYIPEGTEDVIAHTEMIGGGQTTTIEFDAPAAGAYNFLCSFPAHYALMNGKFIVE